MVREMLNPDRCIEQARALHRAVGSVGADWEIGIFHRLSSTMRLRVGEQGESAELLVGRDDGAALQARSRQDGSTVFAACSGLDADHLKRELARAAEHGEGPGGAERELWPLGGEAVSIDRDEPQELPPRADLETWLEKARNELLQPRHRDRRLRPPAECRVEVAVVTETWVADGGLVASRTRRRSWGLARPAAEADRPAQRPLVIASRRWEELPVDGWRTILDDRRIGRGAGKPAGAGVATFPVLFNPECSAELGLGLVKALHDPALDPGLALAASWTITDDPTSPAALFGAKFDDAGFPTAPKILVRGGRLAGRLDGAGHYRRPSYRDRPGPMPTHLGVDVPGAQPPPRFLLVTRVTLHPLGPLRWGLEIDGAVLDGGQPASRVRGGFIATSPTELARRCVASVGPSRPSYLGVQTAALLFDGLPVRI